MQAAPGHGPGTSGTLPGMADEDRGHDGPSLELPSLGFGRRKRRKAAAEAPAPAEPAETQRIVAQPETATGPVPEPGVDDTPTAVTPPPVVSEPTPAAPETRPLFTDEVAPSPLAPPMPTAPAPPVTSGETRTEPDAPAKPSRARRKRRELALPRVGGMAAAVITGVLVGVITVGLTWASQRLCEVVRGTSSCGGPGLLLLIAIMVAMVLLGAVLLRAWGVPDPGSTSFLAVGLLAVIALLFLVDVLFNWWMIIVIPACAVATFALAHWVTATFIEPAEH